MGCKLVLIWVEKVGWWYNALGITLERNLGLRFMWMIRTTSLKIVGKLVHPGIVNIVLNLT